MKQPTPSSVRLCFFSRTNARAGATGSPMPSRPPSTAFWIRPTIGVCTEVGVGNRRSVPGASRDSDTTSSTSSRATKSSLWRMRMSVADPATGRVVYTNELVVEPDALHAHRNGSMLAPPAGRALPWCIRPQHQSASAGIRQTVRKPQHPKSSRPGEHSERSHPPCGPPGSTDRPSAAWVRSATVEYKRRRRRPHNA